ncbi:MAG: B12-binding domain-containing radical SAM protein [Flavobacteriales bacterium]|nr:B12-binding domain-containing radical SAM protein [Flavobacteriales bacterium]
MTEKKGLSVLKTKSSDVEVVFINPRDLVACVPYVKLASLAGTLRGNGIRSLIIEPTATRLSTADVVQRIIDIDPKIVCIGAFPSTLPDAYKLTCELKKEVPNTTLILEGYHVNADPSILVEMDIEWGLRGDAELAFVNLCKHILSGESFDNSIPGLVHYIGGILKDNGPATIKDLDSLPLPAYDLLSVERYYSASTNKRYMQLFTTRGCPYNCNFCANPTQMSFRYLSNERVLQHLNVLVKDCRVEWVEFMDLTFTVNRKRTLSMCQAIIDFGVHFDWGCETRADLIDEELLLKMKDAGCKKITFGVESGAEHVRFRTGKKITNQQCIEAFDLCRKHGVKTMANFIFGHPNETESEMWETVRFAAKLKPFNVMFTRMVPMPDVEVYKLGIKEKQFGSDVWVRYMKGEIEHPTYIPNTIDKSLMNKMYQLAYLRYYLSLRVMRSYLPLLIEPKFFVQSIIVFGRMAFGKPVFK